MPAGGAAGGGGACRGAAAGTGGGAGSRGGGGGAAGFSVAWNCTDSVKRLPKSDSPSVVSSSAYLSSTQFTAKGLGVETTSRSCEIATACVGASHVRNACSGNAAWAAFRMRDQTSPAVSSMTSGGWCGGPRKGEGAT